MNPDAKFERPDDRYRNDIFFVYNQAHGADMVQWHGEVIYHRCLDHRMTGFQTYPWTWAIA